MFGIEELSKNMQLVDGLNSFNLTFRRNGTQHIELKTNCSHRILLQAIEP